MYEEYYDVFKKSPFCKDISMEDYEKFLAAVKPIIKKYKRNEYIAHEGDYLDGAVMVLRGEILQLRTTEYGNVSVFQKLTEGKMFGQIQLMLTNRPKRSFNYYSKTASTVLFFPKENIYPAMLDPNIFTNQIYYNYVYCICKYAEMQMIALRCIRNTTVRQKISAYLYEMYIYYGKKQMEMPLNRSELASYLSMPQSSLSREMSYMKKDGIIDYYKDTVKILDLSALMGE